MSQAVTSTHPSPNDLPRAAPRPAGSSWTLRIFHTVFSLHLFNVQVFRHKHLPVCYSCSQCSLTRHRLAAWSNGSTHSPGVEGGTICVCVNAHSDTVTKAWDDAFLITYPCCQMARDSSQNSTDSRRFWSVRVLLRVLSWMSFFYIS